MAECILSTYFEKWYQFDYWFWQCQTQALGYFMDTVMHNDALELLLIYGICQFYYPTGMAIRHLQPPSALVGHKLLYS